MQRVVRSVVSVLVVVLVGAFVYGTIRIPEHGSIDAAARAGAPGAFATLSQGVTHYDLTGPDTGRVVVLVHGFSVPMYIWDSTVVALRGAGYRVLRYDLYGRGLSDRPDVPYDGATYDRQLDDLLDSLHIAGRIDLMGLSFGGFVTAHYAAGHGARLRTLTFVDPMSSGNQLPWFLRVPVFGPWFWNVTQLPGKAESQYGDFVHPENYPTWADQYRPQMRYTGFGRSLLRSVVATGEVSFDSLFTAVAKTGVPVQLIWGQLDQTIPIAKSEIIRRTIPTVTYVPVDSAGHLPHIERAAFVRERMFAFLAAHP